MLSSVAVLNDENLSSWWLCAARILGCLVPTFAGATLAYRVPRFKVSPPQVGVVVGYHFRNRSHKGYRLVDGVDYSHRGDCTGQHNGCQVLSVTQTGTSLLSSGNASLTKFRQRNPPEPNLGYVLDSGAHDPRDGTFATVAEDGLGKHKAHHAGGARWASG